MADAKQTQGPWEAIMPDDSRGQPVPYYRGLICCVSHEKPSGMLAVVTADGSTVPKSDWEANARLIAAAPTLLAERDRLKEINAELVSALNSINCVTSPGSRTLDDFMRDMGLACDIARAAIAKARNQTPVTGE